MRPRLLSSLLVLSSLVGASATAGAQATITAPPEAAEAPALGRTVPIPHGVGTLAMPQGFRELTSAELKALAPGSRLGTTDEVWRSADGGASILLIVQPHGVATDLSKLKRPIEEHLERRVSPTWITREFVDIGGQRWLHLEIVHGAARFRARQHFFMTQHRGQLVMVSYLADETVYLSEYRDAILASSRSLRLEP